MKMNWEFWGVVVGVSMFWVVIFFVCGCRTIEYPMFNKEGSVAFARYSCLGNQEINGFDAHTDANGVLTVKFEKQKSETELMLQAFGMGIQVGKGR